jgi:hypothetical protein
MFYAWLVVYGFQRTTQCQQVVQRVGGQKIVDERQRGAHTGGHRSIVILAQQGVEPDKAMAVAT